MDTLTDTSTARRDAFVERMLTSTIHALDIFAIYIGHRLSLYRALSENGPMTAGELSATTGCNERYLREWLEHQAVAGILDLHNGVSDPAERRFHLPPGHDEVLVEQDSLNYLAPFTQLVVGVTRPIGSVVDAYCAGGGVPLVEYGDDFRLGQEGANRAMFLQLMGTEWLPAIPALHERLQNDPPARVADIGCGAGWSSIALALAYPKIHVDGYDLDEASIDAARANAAQSGVADRVTFHVRDASDPTLAGQYDLVTAFECVHDMSNPVGALRTMHNLRRDGGTVMIADERVAESFAPVDDPIERLMYGWSVLHCLPVGLADTPSAGTGTVMRPDTLRGYAQAAGYRDVDILPIENDFFRFYRLID